MTVFADRNRVEKEETFELASAARDRFMFELRMPTPAEPRCAARSCSIRIFHDVDELLERVAPGVLPWQELNDIGAAIQRSVHASETLERYVLDLWDATRVAAALRRAHRRRGHGEARCSPARARAA